MGLFTPIWMTNDISKERAAEEAVRKISDPKKLLKIAAAAPRYPVRRAALEGLKDQHPLVELIHGGDEKLQTLAATVIKDPALIRQIPDPNKLLLIAFNASEVAAREAALAAITDQNVLFDAAMNANYRFGERKAAAEHLTDPALLKRVALECDDMYTYNAALARITDEATLVEIALSPTKGGNISAMKRIKDPEALLTILEGAADPSVRREARRRLFYEYIFQSRSDKSLSLTEAQRDRYYDDLIASPEAKELHEANNLSEAVLRRAYRVGANDELRAQALQTLASQGYIPGDQLLDAWREARANSIAAGVTGRHWWQAQESIAVAVANHAPEQLPDFIRNTEFNAAFNCIYWLFKTKGGDDSEALNAARDSAAKAYLDCAMQASEDWLNGNSQAHCMERFVTFVPDDLLKRYGFEVGERYTNGTKYTYEGHVYFVE